MTLAIWKSSTWACIYYDAFFAAAPGWSKQMNKINTKKFPSTKSFNNSSIEYNKLRIPDIYSLDLPWHHFIVITHKLRLEA